MKLKKKQLKTMTKEELSELMCEYVEDKTIELLESLKSRMLLKDYDNLSLEFGFLTFTFCMLSSDSIDEAVEKFKFTYQESVNFLLDYVRSKLFPDDVLMN